MNNTDTIAPTHHLRVRLPVPLYKRAGHLAVERGISIAELARQALLAEIELAEEQPEEPETT
jgi:hypothetical protein